MSQSGFTPIQLYYSTTASTVPSAGNLANGELAINITDGKLFYKDNGGVVQVLATKGAGTIGGATTQVQYNNAGTLAGSSNLTFDGTTLTLGANPVLSGGTANGVPYLNASKVLTTGSALTFDGTNFGVSGNQATAIATTLNNSNATVNAGSILKFNFGATNTGYLWNYYDGADFITALYGSKAVLWNIGSAGGSEQMRLTSTGLGIGTSSVDGKLVVYGTAGTNPYSHFKDASGADFFIQSVGNSDCRTGTASNHPWLFFTNGSEKMRLDSAGNLGLGVTPSAWASFKSITVGDYGASLASSGDDAFFSSNTYYNGGFKYQGAASAAASAYRQKSGVHSWLIAGAGTAGNAISFTQAMTLDASGNLLVGVTSSVGGEVFNATKNLSGQEVARIYNTSATNPYGLLLGFSGGTFNNATNYFFLGLDGSTPRVYLRSNGGIANYSANNVNLSDRREKTNFAPAKAYLDVICSIPVQTYNYIDQNLEEDSGLTLGVVAQDVQAVAPELVTESNWGTEQEPKMRLSIYETDMQYALMKCIQEQQALIVDLQTRLAAAGI